MPVNLGVWNFVTIGHRNLLLATNCPAPWASVLSVSQPRPSVWNSCPNYLHDPARELDSFERQLKTVLFAHCWAQRIECIKDIMTTRCINTPFTYLINLLETTKHKQNERLTRWRSSNRSCFRHMIDTWCLLSRRVSFRTNELRHLTTSDLH